MITPPSTNNNDNYTYAHGSPHSPHTAPRPTVYAKPEYSQQHSIRSPSSDYQHLDHSSSSSATTNSPHTAALQYNPPNPNPQLNHVQLDFIPLPTTRPSAPPQPSTAPLPYVAPPAPVPSPSSVPYPVPTSANSQQQQPQYENVTFVDATPIDMSNEKYKMSAAAGGSTFIQDLRNPRKKSFWIFNIIALAIVLGVLGATVWKPDSNNDKNDPGNSNKGRDTPTTASSSLTSVPSNPMVPTPVTPVVPTPVTVSTTSNSPQPTGGGGGGNAGDWLACRNICDGTMLKCKQNCRDTDADFKSCTAACNGDSMCGARCEFSNGCFTSCTRVWSPCAQSCPRPI
ncbi:hypothetical protein MVEG_04489 [Podila verticillata NRRL 6337]|nr:hypothetical protein MVEG_04489 [Podila verticillata NRRL 6337]